MGPSHNHPLDPTAPLSHEKSAAQDGLGDVGAEHAELQELRKLMNPEIMMRSLMRGFPCVLPIEMIAKLLGEHGVADLAAKWGKSHPDAMFQAGARAMFDNFRYRMANNYHGNPAVQKECDEENALVGQWIEDALQEVSPEDASTWRTINEMYQAGFQSGQHHAPKTPKPFKAPGAWFPVTVTGEPMREIEPGKWQSADWESAQKIEDLTARNQELQKENAKLLLSMYPMNLGAFKADIKRFREEICQSPETALAFLKRAGIIEDSDELGSQVSTIKKEA